MQDIDLKHVGLADLLRPEVLANPYPLFRRLRHEDPVHEDAGGRGWIVSRYDDVEKVLGDRRFSARRVPSARQGADTLAVVQAALSRQMIFLDPPDHTRLRSLFTKTFTPQRMEALKPQVTAMVTGFLNQAEDSGDAIDFIRDFAIPLPVTVIAQMLGVPIGDRDRLRAWSVAFGKLINGRILSTDESREAQVGVMEFVKYFRDLIAERRQHPADDMLSGLIEVEEQGDRLSTEELIVNLILLLAAGHGTTTHLLGNGFLALSRHPEQWARLVASPLVAPAAVNELLRYDGPVQATGRMALEDVPLANKTIKKGEHVTVILGSANRDETRFPAPDNLDLRRADSRPLAFGHGIHTCLGAALARMETQAAFGELARRFPKLKVGEGALEHNPSISFRGLVALPIALNDRASGRK
jgi:cytochrome P450